MAIALNGIKCRNALALDKPYTYGRTICKWHSSLRFGEKNTQVTAITSQHYRERLMCEAQVPLYPLTNR